MERFIAGLTRDLERGRITRRRFCETLTAAAIVHAAGERAANAAPARGFLPLAVNHISYACSDYRIARDFYASVLGMRIAPQSDNGREARLMFGPEPGKAGGFMIPRNGRNAVNPRAEIDHICYAMTGWDIAKARAALSEKGLSTTSGGETLHVRDPFDFDLQIAGARGGAAGAYAVSHVDHISYSSPEFRKTADWYSKIFNLEQTGANAAEVTLPFRKPGGAADAAVADTSLILRAPRTQSTEAGLPPRRSKARVNHIAYTIAGFEQARVRAELKRLGYPNPLKDGEHSFHIVDPNGFDVQISGVEMTALRD